MKRKALLLALSSLFVLPMAAPQTGTSALTAPTAVAATAATPVPPLVPFAGVALNAQGKPLAEAASATFMVFKDEAGGEPLFTETQSIAFDPTGHYKVQLGASLANGIPLDLFSSGEARWLEVQIAGQAQQPRVLLVSVPYALKAADAATLGGLPASAFALAGAKAPVVAAAVGNANVSPDVTSNVTTTGGTSGYLPVFTGGTTVADSIVFQNALGIGIGDVPNAALDVAGKVIVRGPFQMARIGNATTSAGVDSNPFTFYAQTYDTSTHGNIGPDFSIQAEPIGNDTASPGATLNFLYSNGLSTSAETGLYINPNGGIHFASGQTFPGADITGTVNASSYELGGGSLAIGSTSTGSAFIGFSGNGSSTGDLDTGLGYRSLVDNTTGDYNTAVGSYALESNTTGSYNTALGYEALPENSTALENTAVGWGAAFETTTGDYNTALGLEALYYNETGDANTALGFFAGPSTSALFNATAIGYYSFVGQSNSLVLGETESGAPGDEYVDVGIGTATPRSVLEAVVSASETLGPALTLTNSGGGTNAATSIDFNSYLPSTSGTYNPAARIESIDSGSFSDNLVFLSNTPGGSNKGLQTNMTIASNGQIGVGGDTDPAGESETQFTSFGVNGLYGIYGVGSDAGGNDSATDGGYFVGGEAPGSGTGGNGVTAFAGGSDSGSEGYAGVFYGDIDVNGGVISSTKSVKIDHPLDPANKYLVQSSVQSSEQVNIYTGNVVTDELGLATVKLPDWFEAENGDFRYQLTVVGGRFAQAIVSKEVANHQFTISTNASNVKVSWQITGVRQDVYAKAHPLVVEQNKPADEKGFYMHPELYGQPATKMVEWGHHPKQMAKMTAAREKMRLLSQNPGAAAAKLSHDQPASAVTRPIPHPAAPVVKPRAGGPQLKPASLQSSK